MGGSRVRKKLNIHLPKKHPPAHTAFCRKRDAMPGEAGKVFKALRENKKKEREPPEGWG